MFSDRNCPDRFPAQDLLVGEDGVVVGKNDIGLGAAFIQEKHFGRRSGHLGDEILVTDLFCLMEIVVAGDRVAADEADHEKAESCQGKSEGEAGKARTGSREVTDDRIGNERKEK